MEFRLTLTTSNPTKYLVLEQETPLSGLKFVEVAGMVLRCCIDSTSRYRHQTLGALASYTMLVPQPLAIASGLFKDTADATITVSDDILSHFIFYGGVLNKAASQRPCYPYTTNEVVLTSMIDCLTFLDQWAAIGYARKVKVNEQGYLVPDNSKDDDDKKKPGQGCDGCPVHPMPPYGPGGRPGGYPPPPPSPWYQPGANTPWYPVPPQNQAPYPPPPPAPKPGNGHGATRPTGTSTTSSTSGVKPGTIMLGEDLLTQDQFNQLFDD